MDDIDLYKLLEEDRIKSYRTPSKELIELWDELLKEILVEHNYSEYNIKPTEYEIWFNDSMIGYVMRKYEPMGMRLHEDLWDLYTKDMTHIHQGTLEECKEYFEKVKEEYLDEI